MKKFYVTEPYLLTLSPSTEMNIVWIQREPIKGVVEYGNTEQLTHSITAECYEIKGIKVPASGTGYADTPEENSSLELWQCIAKIEGLHPGETVYYRCSTDMGNGENYQTEIYHFHTAPKPGTPFCFAQFSDFQGMEYCDKAAYAAGCKHPDFLLYSGDCTCLTWHADQWFDLGEKWQDDKSAKYAFFSCLQQQNGAKLLQYCPIFICPGNHDVDDLRVGTDPEYSMENQNWSWSIYMQLFRPLYPEADYSLTGKRWYSVDYADLHITSLHVIRWASWSAYEEPGWRLVDSIAPGSAQRTWLEQDLYNCTSKYKWVIQHWHILNKGTDVQPNLCSPIVDEKGVVTYPEDHGVLLMDLFEETKVNGVSFGHSHVYERYLHNGTHYIEAAYFTICYREENAPSHPSGLLPIVEDNSRRSFLMVECTQEGLIGKGYYIANLPELFDVYKIS